ncbi:hypothetical protein RBH20_19355 [Haloarcula sp. H-GB4]|uniref:hypothetical protein n=1 Tax=Haloarcula sp. H-GB4 TaxID=3069755 RepID=UPI0027AED5CD|nr:hypothetical protein [Haloarcula sp. H-GB4]MDQ2074689.1 hypothetical protein [Haloarcula sp. H-GB4]
MSFTFQIRSVLEHTQLPLTVFPAATDQPVPLVLAGLRDPLRDFANSVFAAIFDLIVKLFSDIIEEFLRIDPSYLQQFESIYQVSVTIHLALLSLYAVSIFGSFQLFPSTEKTDPYRFGVRALAATTSIWIVNPPGWGANLFGKGAFAWAFVVTNNLSEWYLSQVGTSISFQSGTIAGALSGPFMLLAAGILIGKVILLAEIVLLVLLVARQVIVLVTYGLYPVLIILWVVDHGPLKYGSKLASKMFKTSTMLLAGGILIAAVFTVGLGLISGSSQIFAGGTPPAQSAVSGPPVQGGVFASSGGGDVILNFLIKAVIIIGILVLPTLMLTQMLGVVGSAVTGIAQVGAAVATSGASAAASLAGQGGKMVAKKGVKKGVKATAKKGMNQAKKGVKKRAKAGVKPGGTAGNQASGRSASTMSPSAQSLTDVSTAQSEQQAESGDSAADSETGSRSQRRTSD